MFLREFFYPILPPNTFMYKSFKLKKNVHFFLSGVHRRELHLSANFVRGLFGPASTMEASNKPDENCDRQLKFNSDTIEYF